MTSRTFTVSGMTCGHCAKAVTEELSGLPGVTDVQVAVDTGRVTVSGDRALDRDAAAAAVTEAGYEISEWPGVN